MTMKRPSAEDADAPGGQAGVPLESSCRPASGWMGERALDSHCGENDRGEELVTMKGPTQGAQTRRVDRPTFHLESSSRPAPGWRIERALDSHCGENDGGWGADV